MIFQRIQRNLMLCQYLDTKWSDPGNRFKKGKETNMGSWETYSIGLMRTFLMRLIVALVKAAVFKSYCDLHNHSVIIIGVFSGCHSGASAHTSENSLIFLPINLADNILVL